MTSKLVAIAATTAPLTLTCGHTSRGNGQPTRYTHRPPRVGDEWECELCTMYLAAAADQNRARAAEE
jgi:hypothetical protein